MELGEGSGTRITADPNRSDYRTSENLSFRVPSLFVFFVLVLWLIELFFFTTEDTEHRVFDGF